MGFSGFQKAMTENFGIESLEVSPMGLPA
jgi:hypothetical protein